MTEGVMYCSEWTKDDVAVWNSTYHLDIDMDRQILILTTVREFLGKFEKENVKILQEMGYSVHYAANMADQRDLFDKEEVEKLGVHIHHIEIERSPYMIRNNKKAFLRLIELVRKYRISIIHCHTPVGGVLGRLLGRYFKKDGIKIIYTAHGFHFYKGAPLINNSIFYWVERSLAHYTDILVVINREDYENGKRLRLKKGGKLCYIPGIGLDMDRFRILSDEERRENRAALGIGQEQFFLVSVGELNDNKNQGIILRALALMRDRGEDISDIVYGVCGDGFLRDRMERQVRELGLEKHVRMFGFHKEITEILGCADLSVFPSRREGLGMAALESLAMGIPVAASDNRGTREYMAEGQNGYVCGYRDVEGFARAIRKCREMKEGEREKMKERCRQSVVRFDKKYTNEIMRDVYRMAEKMVMGEMS